MRVPAQASRRWPGSASTISPRRNELEVDAELRRRWRARRRPWAAARSSSARTRCGRSSSRCRRRCAGCPYVGLDLEPVAVAVTRCVVPLIVRSPSIVTCVTVAGDLRRLEGDLRLLLRVEEVRALQVAVEVLVLDLDARDVDLAGEARLRRTGRACRSRRRSCRGRSRRRVLDGEVGGGVDRVGGPGGGTAVVVMGGSLSRRLDSQWLSAQSLCVQSL